MNELYNLDHNINFKTNFYDTCCQIVNVASLRPLKIDYYNVLHLILEMIV